MGIKGRVDGRSAFALVAGLVVALMVALVAPGASAQSVAPQASGTNGPERVYALTAAEDLLRFDGDRPGEVTRQRITGLREGDSLVGIDFRAANGRLYGLGERGGVYVVDESSATARRISTLRTADGDRVDLRGGDFGIDFNPTVDRLRVVSDEDQNLRVNVETGETTVDPDIRYNSRRTDANTTAVAYTNSRPGAFGGSTRLFYAEANRDVLATSDDPNAGVISPVGRFGFAVEEMAGLDVVTRGSANAAYAALKPEGSSGAGFYNVDRSTGEARRIGTIAEGRAMVEGIAIPINQP